MKFSFELARYGRGIAETHETGDLGQNVSLTFRKDGYPVTYTVLVPKEFSVVSANLIIRNAQLLCRSAISTLSEEKSFPANEDIPLQINPSEPSWHGTVEFIEEN